MSTWLFPSTDAPFYRRGTIVNLCMALMTGTATPGFVVSMRTRADVPDRSHNRPFRIPQPCVPYVGEQAKGNPKADAQEWGGAGRGDRHERGGGRPPPGLHLYVLSLEVTHSIK